MKGSFLLRMGVAIGLVVSGWNAPPSAFASGTVVLIIGALLALLVLLGILGRIGAILAAVYLSLLFASVPLLENGALLALALCSASLVLIHEEHIPWRQRRILSRVFGKRH